MLFSLAGNLNSLAIDKGCVDRYTCRTPHFHMYSRCTDHTARMHVYFGSSLSCVPNMGHSSTRHVSLCASQYTEHSTSSLSLTSPVLLSSFSPDPDLLSTHLFIHCEDPLQDGTSTEFHSSTLFLLSSVCVRVVYGYQEADSGSEKKKKL